MLVLLGVLRALSGYFRPFISWIVYKIGYVNTYTFIYTFILNQISPLAGLTSRFIAL
jgi:hypothetical protein